MLFTAVISIFVSEVLSDTAWLEFITQSSCITHANSLPVCRITQCLYTVPRAPCSCLQLPRRLSIHHYTAGSWMLIEFNSLARHVEHFKCMFLAYKKNAAVPPSRLSKLQDVSWFICEWVRRCFAYLRDSIIQQKLWEPFDLLKQTFQL